MILGQKFVKALLSLVIDAKCDEYRVLVCNAIVQLCFNSDILGVSFWSDVLVEVPGGSSNPPTPPPTPTES